MIELNELECTIIVIILAIIFIPMVVFAIIQFVRCLLYRKCEKCGSKNLMKFSHIGGEEKLCRDCDHSKFFVGLDGLY